MSLRALVVYALTTSFCLQINVYGQDIAYRDSLFGEMENGKIDTNTFYELSRYIDKELYNDPNQALKDAKRALDLALDVSYYRIVPMLIIHQGISHELTGYYDSTIIVQYGYFIQ